MSVKSIPLTFPCPKECICKDRNKYKEWFHKSCQTRSNININGDIFCNNGCDSYFIKDAMFQCSKAQQNRTWYQYKSLSQFLSALSCAVQSAEFIIKNDHELNEFSKQLLSQVNQRWFK